MTKQLWVICETVDLGYHMVKGYTSHEKATAEFNRMVDKATNDKIEALMRIGYTLEKAKAWCSSITFYELECLEYDDE